MGGVEGLVWGSDVGGVMYGEWCGRSGVREWCWRFVWEEWFGERVIMRVAWGNFSADSAIIRQKNFNFEEEKACNLR